RVLREQRQHQLRYRVPRRLRRHPPVVRVEDLDDLRRRIPPPPTPFPPTGTTLWTPSPSTGEGGDGGAPASRLSSRHAADSSRKASDPLPLDRGGRGWG